MYVIEFNNSILHVRMKHIMPWTHAFPPKTMQMLQELDVAHGHGLTFTSRCCSLLPAHCWPVQIFYASKYLKYLFVENNSSMVSYNEFLFVKIKYFKLGPKVHCSLQESWFWYRIKEIIWVSRFCRQDTANNGNSLHHTTIATLWCK